MLACSQKPTLYISLEARKTVTESVIESLVSLFNSTTGLIDSMCVEKISRVLVSLHRDLLDLTYIQSANLHCVVAIHDRLVPESQNKIVDYLDIIQHRYQGFYEPG